MGSVHAVAERGGVEELERIIIEDPRLLELKSAGSESTPLIVASRYGRTSLVQWLVNNGSDIEAKDIDARTSLCRACSKGHAAIVSLLMDKGANVNTRSKSDYTPLMRTSSDGRSVMTSRPSMVFQGA